MKKILEQLELHVQWLALLLGIVFVLYVAYAYLLEPPVKTEVAGTQLSPGEVDDYIWQHAGNDLDQRTKPKGVPPMESPNLLSLFTEEINYRNKPLPAPPLSTALAINKDNPADPNKPESKETVASTSGVIYKNNVVTGMPTLLAMKVNGFRSGMSNVTPMPDPAAPGAPAPVDKTWVTVRGEIDVNAIAKAFADVKIPAGTDAGKTSFLQLAMEREEKLSDGSWGKATLVPHIKTSEVQELPAADAPAPAQWGYLNWADGHTVDIMQPAFYTVLKGDPWGVPGEAVTALANNQPQAAAFDPQQYINMTPAQLEAAHLTPDQKRLVYAARTKIKDAGRPRGAPRGSRGMDEGGAPPGYGGPSGGYPRGPQQRAPQDAARPPGYGGPPGGYPTGPGGRPIGSIGSMGEPGESEGYPGVPGGMQQASANFPMPTGSFDPTEWLKANSQKTTITVWSHDETALPGHTYRYRMTYSLKNPLFKTTNLAKNAKLTDVFSISPPAASEWTEDVTIIPMVNFWITKLPRTAGGAVDMQVFRWQAGSTVSKQFTVNPGDMIGAPDAQSDFTTGWTLVDVMTDPRTQLQYVLVIDPNGVIHKRDFDTDSKDPKLRSWRDQAAVALVP